MRAANDGLRFLLELSALAAVAYWGWSEHGSAWRWVLVVAAPLAVALVWGRWMAPKSRRRVRDPWRLAIDCSSSAPRLLRWPTPASLCRRSRSEQRRSCISC